MAVADNWEDLLDELEEPAAPPCSPEAAKPTKTKSPLQQQQQQRQQQQQQQFDEPLDDPMEERLRRQKLTEEAEKRLMNDLFGGCEQPEAAANENQQKQTNTVKSKVTAGVSTTSGETLESVQLKTFRDCEKFVEKISHKIVDSPAKSPAWLRLLDLLLKECSPKMDLKDEDEEDEYDEDDFM
ncbi:uncharacterized protein EMH_0045500 [Eimeria mitis]|uniref:Eukaryotic translation initiation factor 3 30 kDa subunit n=1 Tax=Eimeria mitis TaxID=44415 RepID=U6JU81_9EIME|nr:uncharacterized protein EMH_0045500 [Eimeria mitis]CDJ28954.1 hypothetical protein, conserved [Eimeria mitis]